MGLEAPNILMYYLINHSQFLNCIHIISGNQAWVDLNQNDFKDIKLTDMPFIET